MKAITSIILAVLLVVMLVVPMSAPMAAEKGVEGKALYTQVNIWFEAAKGKNRGYSTNYHKGEIIPAGTKVTVTEIGRKAIEFRDEKGTEYELIFVAKHHPGMKAQDFADLLFKEENPAPRIAKMSAEDRAGIKDGKLVRGMTKDGCVIAFGYPPAFRTPSLDADAWIYQDNKWSTAYTVRFENGKLKDIQK